MTLELAQKTILVVDDEPDLRESVAEAFARRGSEVLKAGNGQEALALLKDRRVDGVVSDIRMPRMSGIELLSRLREADAAAPAVILMSGYADATIDEIYDMGAEAMLAKPFSMRLLVDVVIAALRPREQAWSERVAAREAPGTIIRRQLSDPETVRQARIFSIGRGGFFLAAGQGSPRREERVGFEIEFETGGLSTMKGTGIVRWVRTSNNGDLPAGCGIEFESLSGACLAPLLALLKGHTPRAFIPRG